MKNSFRTRHKELEFAASRPRIDCKTTLWFVFGRRRLVLVALPLEANQTLNRRGNLLVRNTKCRKERWGFPPVFNVVLRDARIGVFVIPLQILSLGVPDPRPGSAKQNIQRKQG